MKCYMGVDLGSTTTKAVVLGDDGSVLGRGITNSRSNYDTAAQVAQQEALIDARFRLIAAAARRVDTGDLDRILESLERAFRLEQFLASTGALEEACHARLEEARYAPVREEAHGVLGEIFAALRVEAPTLFAPGAERRSDFFRDLAGALFVSRVEAWALAGGTDAELYVNLFDRAIIEVENRVEHDPEGLLGRALRRTVAGGSDHDSALALALETALATDLDIAWVVGTGYGRARLPFSKEHIRSEILCHGLGAHVMFPGTRTVLDIGGQDTKAIQLDEHGIVDGFQMNDRCAAGCGRYLGYIADEMQLGLHQLGPLALQSTRTVRINSTCTVFAGAELRDRLAVGEKREDVLAGLHRAIVLRALSLLSRSGGVFDELTFTGGVARNEAAVKALRALVEENYGPVTLNISPESIYTGALGAATFARRAVAEAEA